MALERPVLKMRQLVVPQVVSPLERSIAQLAAVRLEAGVLVHVLAQSLAILELVRTHPAGESAQVRVLDHVRAEAGLLAEPRAAEAARVGSLLVVGRAVDVEDLLALEGGVTVRALHRPQLRMDPQVSPEVVRAAATLVAERAGVLLEVRLAVGIERLPGGEPFVTRVTLEDRCVKVLETDGHDVCLELGLEVELE